MTILLDDRFEITAWVMPDGWMWQLCDIKTNRTYNHSLYEEMQIDVVREAMKLIDDWLWEEYTENSDEP